MLDFKNWQASRTFTLDLDEVFGCPGLSDGTTGMGYVYGGNDDTTILSYICIIEHGDGHSYYLTISNGDWVSKDLAELEEKLYWQWVVSESETSGEELDEMINQMKETLRLLQRKQLN